MSVIGIDFGTQNAVISQAKRGGIETMLNEASKRATLSVVSFQGKQRFMGVGGAALISSNFKNTVRDLKRFVGKSWSDPQVQADIQKCPNKEFFHEMEGDKIGIKVNYQDQTMSLTPDDVCAMFIGSLKQTAELTSGRAVSDIVFSVPAFWTDRQRRAFLAASKIAKVDVLGLINDGTAAALSYGIWKSAGNQFDAEKKEYIMFVDMGFAGFQVTIAAYVQGKLTVVANAYDSNLGGRDIDFALAEHFSNEFKSKHGDAPLGNAKATIKLLTACEKLKQTFTPDGVTEAPIKIEYLLNEIDFSSKLTLETFDELIAPVVERLEGPLLKAMEDSGLTVNDLTAIEILGGSTRVRAIKRRIAEVLGLDMEKPMFGLSATQNGDECISRGCALRSAMLSPSFRVKEFAVKDTVMFPINVTWEQTEPAAMDTSADGEKDEDGDLPSGENSVTLFGKGAEIPMTRRIIFRRREAFEIQASYPDELASLLPNGETSIGSFRISGMSVHPDELPPKIRVDFKQDEFGLFRVVKAEQMQEIPAAASPEPNDAPAPAPGDSESKKKEEGEGKEEGGASAEQGEEESGSKETGEADKEEGEGKKEEGKQAEASAEKVKKKFRALKLSVESVFTQGYSEGELLNARAREEEFKSVDDMVKATQEAKNSLETFVYAMRDDLDMSLREFCTEDERESVKEKLTATENWLYEDGYYEEEKSVFDKRLNDLKAETDVFVTRKAEHDGRPGAVQALRDEIASNLGVVNSPDDAYAHISDEERDTVKKECEDAEAWIQKQLDAQAERNFHQDPVITIAEIDAKTVAVRKSCRPIVTKKKPEPPKKEEKEASDENKKEEATGEPPRDGDEKMEEGEGADDSKKEAKSDEQENDMDVD